VLAAASFGAAQLEQAAQDAQLEQAAQDASRCLACDRVCEICVDVCPNRANVSIDLGEEFGKGFLTQRHQILHLDGLCNECGNCGVFCPTAGNPYLDKLTLFSGEEDFANSDNKGFLPLGAGRYRIRLGGGEVFESTLDSAAVPATVATMMRASVERYGYLIR
jgi:putative selenate reductase